MLKRAFFFFFSQIFLFGIETWKVNPLSNKHYLESVSPFQGELFFVWEAT